MHGRLCLKQEQCPVLQSVFLYPHLTNSRMAIGAGGIKQWTGLITPLSSFHPFSVRDDIAGWAVVYDLFSRHTKLVRWMWGSNVDRDGGRFSDSRFFALNNSHLASGSVGGPSLLYTRLTNCSSGWIFSRSFPFSIRLSSSAVRAPSKPNIMTIGCTLGKSKYILHQRCLDTPTNLPPQSVPVKLWTLISPCDFSFSNYLHPFNNVNLSGICTFSCVKNQTRQCSKMTSWYKVH